MRPWGKLYKITNMVTFELSPFEQKAFHGMLKGWRNYIVNYIPVYAPWFLPPPIISYMIWDWAVKTHERLERKNPKDFENDE